MIRQHPKIGFQNGDRTQFQMIIGCTVMALDSQFRMVLFHPIFQDSTKYLRTWYLDLNEHTRQVKIEHADNEAIIVCWY